MTEIEANQMPGNTSRIFHILANQNFINRYTLVGGTALSIQIKHRLSEDLDFIFDGEQLSINSIKRNINTLFPENRVIKQDYANQIDFVIDQVKVTFFASHAVAVLFEVRKHAIKYQKLHIANLEAIAALKFAAIAQRNTIRDYYDLYFLAKYHLGLTKMMETAKQLLPNLAPVTYTETLVYLDDIEETTMLNHLNPAEKVSKQEMANYFTGELRKIVANTEK